MKTKEILKQLAFDIFDVNNDNKISEGDIFRIFKSFTSSDSEIISSRNTTSSNAI